MNFYVFVYFSLVQLIKTEDLFGIDSYIDCNNTDFEDDITHGFCQGANEPLYLPYIRCHILKVIQNLIRTCCSVAPWPVILGENISVLAHLHLYEQIPDNSRVDVVVTREYDGTNVTIPCIPHGSTNIGSCSYNGSYFIQTFFPNFFCPDQVRSINNVYASRVPFRREYSHICLKK